MAWVDFFILTQLHREEMGLNRSFGALSGDFLGNIAGYVGSDERSGEGHSSNAGDKGHKFFLKMGSLSAVGAILSKLSQGFWPIEFKETTKTLLLTLAIHSTSKKSRSPACLLLLFPKNLHPLTIDTFEICKTLTVQQRSNRAAKIANPSGMQEKKSTF